MLRCFDRVVLSLVVLFTVVSGLLADEPPKVLKAGIIGLDTSHVVEFTKLLNDPHAPADLAGVKVVAAYPGGTRDNPNSWDRVKKFTESVRGMNVEIADSIDEVLKKVDVVLIESVDGRPHLEEARQVIAAGKPFFIDKPMAISLADVIEIFRLAKEKHVPCFSASSARFSPAFQAFRKKTSPLGDAKSCTAWSPMHLEPHHPDLFWYGVHGVEILYTIMGPGCKTVTRAGPEKVVGDWGAGRTGTYVAKKDYGAEVEGTLGKGPAGKYQNYKPLVVEIVKFFKTGEPPVQADETIEEFAFMEAADESKRQSGAPVSIESMMKKAEQKHE